MPTKYRRVTVTLPARVVDALDHKLTEPDETRSAVIRRLVVRALREADEREAEERWVRGYLEQPQTEEELAWADLIEDADPAHVPPW
jgi:metal-responsive CopG/Arc/MetJ family transcriptional regulator